MISLDDFIRWFPHCSLFEGLDYDVFDTIDTGHTRQQNRHSEI
jgi:hypothetical protein